ncbi:MAG: hypothetical protein CVU39_03305 [Chloroflexi bacterium HGW-Chloroflexi-10]|nr:MAG: hypothetical protein CVU39_03305 [Chloroflexi bacterium HGW-Chloroflexi-10]
MISAIIHINNEEAVFGEIEDMPSPKDQLIIVKGPRRKDGKDISYLDTNVTTVIWPMHRINFIEIVPSGEEEEIVSFVRG